jgi:multidrug resistance efflux pump
MRQERRRFSTNARIYFTTVPILPSVKGRVIEVPVEDNTNRHLEAGAVLFKIDPKPYEYAVAEKRAGLADAEASVAQLKALVDQASATVEKAKAQLQLAQENYDRQATLFQKNVVAQATLDTATRNLDASKQTVAEAVAAEDRARQAYGATVDGEHSVIVRLRNELADAQYDLDQTVVRAPAPRLADKRTSAVPDPSTPIYKYTAQSALRICRALLAGEERGDGERDCQRDP